MGTVSPMVTICAFLALFCGVPFALAFGTPGGGLVILLLGIGDCLDLAKYSNHSRDDSPFIPKDLMLGPIIGDKSVIGKMNKCRC